jgi:type I restriction enzyme S subunit
MNYKPLGRVPYLHPWPEEILGMVATVTVGGTPSTDVPAFWGGDVPWMASGDVHRKRITEVDARITDLGLRSSNATLVDPPAVAVALAGQGKTRGTVAKVLSRLCTNQSVALIVGKAGELHPDYLFHNLDYRYEELRARSSGGGRGGLSKGILENTPIPTPDHDEQARIAELLDIVDVAVRESQGLVEKNELVYGGLQELFFTPRAVRAREDWQETRLADLAGSITSGPRGWASYYADEGDFFLRIGNLTRKHLDLRFDDVVKVKPPVGAEGVRTALAPGDLLISITADLGIIGVVPDWMGVAYINQHIARARLDRTKVNPRFLGYQLAGLIGQKQFYRLNDVGAKAGLNLPAVGGLKAWLPPLAEQDRIAGTLDGLQEALRQEEAVLSKLKSLKSGLSSDLLTGRVRISA